MRRLRTRRSISVLIAGMLLFQMLAQTVVAVPAPIEDRDLAVAPATDAFQRTWARTDQPVASGLVDRTWMWGPDGSTEGIWEPYADSPGGERQVQYFDKSRMEITDPNREDDGLWYVTNGLLVVEMVTGQMQTGNDDFESRSPAQVNVAGDPGDSTGPTYASFNGLRNRSAHSEGALISERLDRGGNVSDDSGLATYDVRAARFVADTNHTVAAPFWEFMNSSGTVHVNGSYSTAALFQNPFYATGFPITEAYWANVQVGGTYKDVLMQCFERRCLTYTPDNSEGWQVEAGNVGLHYYEWRYFEQAPTLETTVSKHVGSADGGSVSLDGVATIVIPPGALTADAMVTISVDNSNSPPTDPQTHHQWLGPAVLIDITGGTLRNEATIEFNLPNVLSQLHNSDDDQMVITYFDASIQRWIPLDSIVNRTRNVIETRTRQVGEWWRTIHWTYSAFLQGFQDAANLSPDFFKNVNSLNEDCNQHAWVGAGGTEQYVSISDGLSDNRILRGCITLANQPDFSFAVRNMRLFDVGIRCPQSGNTSHLCTDRILAPAEVEGFAVDLRRTPPAVIETVFTLDSNLQAVVRLATSWIPFVGDLPAEGKTYVAKAVVVSYYDDLLAIHESILEEDYTSAAVSILQLTGRHDFQSRVLEATIAYASTADGQDQIKANAVSVGLTQLLKSEPYTRVIGEILGVAGIVTSIAGALELFRELFNSDPSVVTVDWDEIASEAQPPVAPHGLTTHPWADGGNQPVITLSWVDASDNESGFKIYYRTPSGTTWYHMIDAPAGVDFYDDHNVAWGSTWCYSVTAFNSYGESARSNESCGTLPADPDGGNGEPPAAPTNLSIYFHETDGPYSVTLNWNDNSSNETGFEIYGTYYYEDQPNHFIGTVGPGVESTTYPTDDFVCYAVRAYNSEGVSGWSNIECAEDYEPLDCENPYPGPTEVVVFEHTNYAGRCQVFSESTEDPDFNYSYIGNDTVSSLRVGSDVYAHVCEHTYFAGHCVVFNYDEPDLNLMPQDFGNDIMSSIAVWRKCGSGGAC